MRKITYLFFMFFIVVFISINAHAQSSFVETKTIDISGVESWDAQGSLNNELITVELDAFEGMVGCDNPVLEIIGAGFETNQSTIEASWLSEMKIILLGLVITPGFSNNNSGTNVSYSSEGIIDLVGLNLVQEVSNDVSGSIILEFYESFDDVANAIDGTYNTGNITLQYRLSCSNTMSTESISDLKNIVMYPSLVKDFVTFGNPQNIILKYAQIYDISGKLVQTFDLSDVNEEKSFDVHGLASGSYIVKIQTETGNLVKRLVKQ